MNSSSCKPRDSHAPFFPFAVAKVLQKTNTNQIFQQLFFKNFSQKSPKHHKSATYPTIFYALQHIFPSPSLKQSHTDIIRPISHHLLHCKNKKAPTLKMSRLFLLYIRVLFQLRDDCCGDCGTIHIDANCLCKEIWHRHIEVPAINLVCIP